MVLRYDDKVWGNFIFAASSLDKWETPRFTRGLEKKNKQTIYFKNEFCCWWDKHVIFAYWTLFVIFFKKNFII